MKRSIKDSGENSGTGRVPITSPSGEGGKEGDPPPIPYFPYSPRFAVAIGTEGVIIEGEGCFVCTEVYVGFGSGGHKEKGLCRWRNVGRRCFYPSLSIPAEGF